MTKEQMCRELEIITNAPQGSLSGEEQLGNMAAWDSLARVMFLAMVDEQIGKSIETDELKHCKDIGDLVALVNR